MLSKNLNNALQWASGIRTDLTYLLLLLFMQGRSCLIRTKCRNSASSIHEPHCHHKKLAIYLGTDYNQDMSGMFQAVAGTVKTIPLYTKGQWGQITDINVTPEAILLNRTINETALTKLITDSGFNPSQVLLIGQTWAFCFSPEYLHRLKQQGISFILISMDDKHSFIIPSIHFGDLGVRPIAKYSDTILSTTAFTRTCLPYHEDIRVIPLASPLHSIKTSIQSDKPACYKDIDVLFIGKNYGYRSHVICYLISNGINVTCYGSGWPNGKLDPECVCNTYNRSKIVLGFSFILNSRRLTGIKLRDFEVTAAGAFYLTSYSSDLSNYFEEGKHLCFWRNKPDLLTKVRYYLASDKERQAIATQAAEHSLRYSWTELKDAVSQYQTL